MNEKGDDRTPAHARPAGTAGKDTAAGIDYQDERGADRYVGGGPQGGQNYANEGYAASQSASAGDGYASAPEHAQGKSQSRYAVSPDDLGVEDYDLQGGYGRPPEDEAPGK